MTAPCVPQPAESLGADFVQKRESISVPPESPKLMKQNQGQTSRFKVYFPPHEDLFMKTILPVALLIILTAVAVGQEPSDRQGGFLLGAAHVGIGFGHVDRVNGIRFNWSDDGFDFVNGINFTLWRPADRPWNGTINGLALGVVAPAAEEIHGLAITPGVVLTHQHMIGVGLGGLALVSNGSVTGVNAGGLAIVAEENVQGISFGGLGLVSQKDMIGVNVAGLGTVAQGRAIGFSFAGLGTVSQGDMIGINLAGLGTVSQGNMTGLNFAGLGTVSQGDLGGISIAGLGTVANGAARGINIGGIAVVAQRGISGFSFGAAAIVSKEAIKGVNLTVGQLQSNVSISGLNTGLYKIDAPSISGINVGLVWTESDNLSGFTISGYNRTFEMQRGIVIGLLNHTADLFGLQIGLLNIVESNDPPFRYLPLLNFRF